MTKVLAAALAVLVLLLGLPLGAAVIISMGVGAAAECTGQALTPVAPVAPVTPGLPIAGPVGGPVRGDVVVAQANIPDRVGDSGFTASMPRVLSTRPDFVSLNEMSGRSIAQIEAAAPGYAAFREPDAVPGPSARESLGNVVAWRADTWTRVAGGRVTIVEGDHGFYDGRPILWDRFVTWTMLQRDDGAVVSMLSTHHMINPHKYPRQWGNPPLTRAQQYGQGMDVLTSLAASLAAHGPVLIAGDMNTHASYIDLAWSAVAKMREAGYGWHATAIDFVFYPQHLGVTLAQGWSGTMQSDHPWIAARLAMNGAGPTGAPTATTPEANPPTAVPTTTGGADDCALVTTVTVGTCTDPSANPSFDPYGLGPVQPQLARLVAILAPLFAIERVGGYRDSARDPGGHPAGLAADFMVPLTGAGELQGTALADYARTHATELGVDYIVWNQRIWSSARADEGWRPMRDRGNATENHRDHVHINALPTISPIDPSNPSHAAPTSPLSVCPEVVRPVPQQYIDADQHNWHDAGPSWSSWHTGTDFSMPCGTPVYAAHAGTIEIDTTQPWAGPHLVKVTTRPSALATWYAHLESVTVSRGQTVIAGDQIGTTGDLGNARGCHLHFEVHTQNGPIYGPDNVDPSPWLATHVRTGSTDRASRKDTQVHTGLHAGAGARAVGAQEAHHAA